MTRIKQPSAKSASQTPPSEVPSRLVTPRLYAGTSGWAYPTWKPGFYPVALPQKSFLAYYASRLTAVEVNYTFRALPTPKMLADWLAATPPHFRFSFKAPQRITHFSRLLRCETPLSQFLFALSPIHEAGRIGPILFQLPPNFQADPTRLEAFLDLPLLAGSQIAFEFRHASWFTEETYTLLRRHNAALCIAEGDDLITPEIHTADHLCYRLRRGGGYTPAEISAFADHLTPLTSQHDLYVFFRHEDEPTGALNAAAFLDHAAAAGAP